MTIQLSSFLEGRWQVGMGEGVALMDPTTDAVLARASTEGLDLGAALEFARAQGGPALRALTFAQRGALLSAMTKAIHAQREELVALAMQNGGNTRGDAKFDIDGGTATMAYYAKLAESLGERRFLVEEGVEQLALNPRYVGQHVSTPLTGVAVHINAFNFPAWGLLEKAAVAILAGVPVVTKPATSTALVAWRVMQLIDEAKVLPAGVLSMVTGPAGDLLDHVRYGDAVAFTGSSGVGEEIRASVGGRARVNVEADSLNAAILGPDVESDSETYALFLRECAKELTQKAGQKCTATRRIFVPATVIDQVCEDLSEEVGAVKVGNPELREVRMGPLASRRQLEDVQAGIARLAESCQFVRGDGQRGALVDVAEGKGCFVAPVLLRAPSHTTAAVHSDEVFGPVATLLPYSGAAQAVEGVVLGRGGLVASVYTDDKDFAAEVLQGIAPWSGRVTFGSARVAEHSPGPGMVMPQLVHGGPGRAGGGEELGGLRGLSFYWQRTAVQGAKPLLEKLLA